MKKHDYEKLLYKHEKNWLYKIKGIDRKLSYFLVKPSSIVCDVGGAKGVDAFALAERGAFAIDLDTNLYALRYAKKIAKKSKLNPQLSFIRASATNLPFRSKTLDLVTCFSTLDHLPKKRNAHEAINEFSRVVRSLGYVAITVPNKFFLIGTIAMKIKNITEPDTFVEHRFTPSELWKSLTSFGLIPILFDSEYPISVAPGILEDHFPKVFKKVPYIFILLAIIAKLFAMVPDFLKLFGARMGYLSVKQKVDDN